MKLSKRLRTVAEQVSDSEVAADVGCDHGFTSIYLVRTGRAKRVIAMDIGKEPLLRAKEHILQYGMEDKIEIRQSDGLEQLKKGEADTLVISGLGGQLMCRILKEGKEKLPEMRELVLSPQSDIRLVRELLHELGFCITREHMVLDAGKYYVIINAAKGVEKYSTEAEYIYGRDLIRRKEPVFFEYLQKEYRKVTEIIGRLKETKLSEEGSLLFMELLKKQEQICQLLHKMGEEEVRDYGKIY